MLVFAFCNIVDLVLQVELNTCGPQVSLRWRKKIHAEIAEKIQLRRDRWGQTA